MAEQNILYLTSGGETQVQISFFDDASAVYTLPQGHTFSSFIISAYTGGTPKIKKSSYVSITSSTVTILLTSTNTQTLLAGKYVGQIIFAVSGGGFVFSDSFVVVVLAKPNQTVNAATST